MLAIVSIQLLVLLVSGVLLFFTYRPSGGAAHAELLGEPVRSNIDTARIAQVAHQVAARSVVPTAIVAGALVALRHRAPARRRVDVFTGVGLALVMAAGSYTGRLLPWDLLGLWSVSVGKDIRGYAPLFDDGQIRFALIGGAEVHPGTVVRWLLVHMVVVGGVAGALVATAWRRGSHRSVEIEPDTG